MGGGKTLKVNSFRMHQGDSEAPSLCKDSQVLYGAKLQDHLVSRDHMDLYNEDISGDSVG